MIMRIWHGYTSSGNADAYEEFLQRVVLPGIHRVQGYLGAWLLRQPKGDEVEFITITTWDSWEAIEEFAGAGRTKAIVPPRGQALLLRYDEHSQHYDATWVP
jgi:heme-degrading monooxygenase HmoA